MSMSIYTFSCSSHTGNTSSRRTEKLNQVVELSSDDSEAEAEKTESDSVESDDLLKVISWNIDGLDAKNLDLRTKHVCSIVKKLVPLLFVLDCTQSYGEFLV